MFFVFTGNWTIGKKKISGPSVNCCERHLLSIGARLIASNDAEVNTEKLCILLQCSNKQLNGNLFWRQIAPMPSCSILLAMSTLNDMETHSVEMPIDSDDVICGVEREKVAATLNLYLADFRMNMRREESDEAKTVLNSIQCPVFFFRLRS